MNQEEPRCLGEKITRYLGLEFSLAFLRGRGSIGFQGLIEPICIVVESNFSKCLDPNMTLRLVSHCIHT